METGGWKRKCLSTVVSCWLVYAKGVLGNHRAENICKNGSHAHSSWGCLWGSGFHSERRWNTSVIPGSHFASSISLEFCSHSFPCRAETSVLFHSCSNHTDVNKQKCYNQNESAPSWGSSINKSWVWSKMSTTCFFRHLHFPEIPQDSQSALIKMYRTWKLSTHKEREHFLSLWPRKSISRILFPTWESQRWKKKSPIHMNICSWGYSQKLDVI